MSVLVNIFTVKTLNELTYKKLINHVHKIPDNHDRCIVRHAHQQGETHILTMFPIYIDKNPETHACEIANRFQTLKSPQIYCDSCQLYGIDLTAHLE